MSHYFLVGAEKGGEANDAHKKTMLAPERRDNLLWPRLERLGNAKILLRAR